jgi:hypothetical protein
MDESTSSEAATKSWDVARLEDAVTRLKGDNAQLRIRIAELEEGFIRIDAALAELLAAAARGGYGRDEEPE